MPSATSLLSRPYAVTTVPFEVVTKDGVHLVGDRLGSAETALVFCHGFLGWRRKARLVRFQEELSASFTVYAFDFRGHGQSGGLSTFGVDEYVDVDAVVRQARADGFGRVVTMGGSMGGIAVIRHAALAGGVDATVAVSTPAGWEGHDSRAIRRMTWLTATPGGRAVLRSFGVRVTPTFRRAEAPADVVARIAPTPLVIVHGRDDHYFDEEQAWALYRRAEAPKRLLLADRFGHAEDGYTPRFAKLTARTIQDVLAVPQTPGGPEGIA